MFVDLPNEFKGTHMSRFIEVLNSHGNMVHVENIDGHPPRDAGEAQRRDRASGNGIPIFPHQKSARVTGMESVMDYTARFDATACGKDIDFVLTVKVGSPRCALAPRQFQNTARTINAAFALCRFVRAKPFGSKT